MSLTQGVIQPPFDVVPEYKVDGQNAYLGRQHEVLMSKLMPDYYQMCYSGKLFSGSQAPAGAAPELWSATTQQCGLFNPLGSGVNLILTKLNAFYRVTTGVPNCLVIGYKTGCGATIATAAPVITAATQTTPVALNLSGAVAKAQFLSAGITTLAPAYLMKTDLNQQTVVSTGTSFMKLGYVFNGELIVPEGGAIFVSSDITSIGAVYSINLIWGEVKA